MLQERQQPNSPAGYESCQSLEDGLQPELVAAAGVLVVAAGSQSWLNATVVAESWIGKQCF